MPNFAPTNALVAKLVDAPDLGSGDFGRVGSSPIRRTLIQQTRPLIGGLVYFIPTRNFIYSKRCDGCSLCMFVSVLQLAVMFLNRLY